jgi:hypothetical protein
MDGAFPAAEPERKPTAAYTYFNPACSKGSDPYYGCTANLLPGPLCDSARRPSRCDPYSAPMQITRFDTMFHIGKADAQGRRTLLLPLQLQEPGLRRALGHLQARRRTPARHKAQLCCDSRATV